MEKVIPFEWEAITPSDRLCQEIGVAESWKVDRVNEALCVAYQMGRHEGIVRGLEMGMERYNEMPPWVRLVLAFTGWRK